jgi:S-adenosylmethionine hydrolase
MPTPEKTANGWRAHITVIDVFGNLTTDLPAAYISTPDTITIHIRGQEVRGLVTSYGNKKPGELVALVDSENYIEVAIVKGSAQKTLNAMIGDVVEFDTT